MHTVTDLCNLDREIMLLNQQQAHTAKRLDNLTALRIYIAREIEEGGHEPTDDAA